MGKTGSVPAFQEFIALGVGGKDRDGIQANGIVQGTVVGAELSTQRAPFVTVMAISATPAWASWKFPWVCSGSGSTQQSSRDPGRELCLSGDTSLCVNEPC